MPEALEASTNALIFVSFDATRSSVDIAGKTLRPLFRKLTTPSRSHHTKIGAAAAAPDNIYIGIPAVLMYHFEDAKVARR